MTERTSSACWANPATFVTVPDVPRSTTSGKSSAVDPVDDGAVLPRQCPNVEPDRAALVHLGTRVAELRVVDELLTVGGRREFRGIVPVVDSSRSDPVVVLDRVDRDRNRLARCGADGGSSQVPVVESTDRCRVTQRILRGFGQSDPTGSQYGMVPVSIRPPGCSRPGLPVCRRRWRRRSPLVRSVDGRLDRGMRRSRWRRHRSRS